MPSSITFLINSSLLGIGLAMDAFAVSIANGLSEPHMPKQKLTSITGVFSIFQGMMPMLGWVCIHCLMNAFHVIRPWIPVISLVLLLYIGSEMIIEGIRQGDHCEAGIIGIGVTTLLLQGIATSIDALAVGFTIASLRPAEALYCALIIAVITFFLCLLGLLAGRRLGALFCGRAKIAGGIVLILIGIKIFFGTI